MRGANGQSVRVRLAQLWDALTAREQHRLIDLIVQRVDYHGGSNKIVVTFYETGIKSLAGEQGEAA